MIYSYIYTYISYVYILFIYIYIYKICIYIYICKYTYCVLSRCKVVDSIQPYLAGQPGQSWRYPYINVVYMCDD